jgi:hypothetical protein
MDFLEFENRLLQTDCDSPKLLVMVSLRQLLVIVLLVLGFWIFKRLQSRLRSTKTAGRRWLRRSTVGYENMVPCAHCGIHVPRSRAVIGQWNRFFCCNEHRDANKAGDMRSHS